MIAILVQVVRVLDPSSIVHFLVGNRKVISCFWQSMNQSIFNVGSVVEDPLTELAREETLANFQLEETWSFALWPVEVLFDWKEIAK